MTELEFTRLVDRHSQVWARAGAGNSGLVFDPAAGHELQIAREISKQLIDAFRGASNQNPNSQEKNNGV